MSQQAPRQTKSKYDGVMCSVVDCNNNASCRHEVGPVCNAHYLRFRRSGHFGKRDEARQSEDPAYRVWINMKSRCLNPNATGFDLYGGRGISIHPSWLASFEKFLSDVGPRPTGSHTLDRIDVNGDYEPGNCRWATQTQQCRNMRVNHIVVIGGERMTLAEAAELAPVPYNTVLYRLKRGWHITDAITLPAHKGVRP
jgi:hypothetical protein